MLAETFSSAKDNLFVYTNLPPFMNWFYKHLLFLHDYFPDADVSIHHLIHFQIHRSSSYDNLKILGNTLPLCLSNILNYNVWYYYSKLQDSDMAQEMFPFFVITPFSALKISGDFSKIMLHKSIENISIYSQEFLRIRSHALPLIYKCSSLENAVSKYLELYPSNVNRVYTLGYSPRFFDVMESSEIKEFLEKQNLIPDNLVKELYHHFSVPKEIYSIFTFEGINDFLSNGKIYGQMGAIFSPIPSHLREHLMDNLLKNSYSHHRIARESVVLPQNISLELLENHFLLITQFQNPNDITLFFITESSICESFHDYILSLSDLENTLSEQESNTYIREKL